MDDVPSPGIVMTLWRGSDDTLSAFVMSSLPRPRAPQRKGAAPRRNATPTGLAH